MLKLPGLCPGPHWGRSQRSPHPLAGFKPIFCLLVFFIGPNCMRISLFPRFSTKSFTHRTEIISWHGPRCSLGGPIRFGGPVSTFVSPGNFSLLGPGHTHGLVLATQTCLRPHPQIPCYNPEWFYCFAVSISRTGSISRNKTIYTALCTLILRLKLSHNAFENKVYCDLATTLYYFQIRKGNESTGQKS